LAKIALDLEKALNQRAVQGALGQTNVHLLAKGDHWKVEDVICTAGPQDRRFEERHVGVTIAIVAAGSFQYRGSVGQSIAQELMTPGSLVLGNAGQSLTADTNTARATGVSRFGSLQNTSSALRPMPESVVGWIFVCFVSRHCVS
jgi:hypothetical protein